MTKALKISHAKVAREGVLLNVAGAVAFAVLMAVVAGALKLRLEGTPLIIAGLVLALVPAALFLLAFMRADRIEPEPRGLVLGVFFLGALLAYAIGQPVIRDVFKVQNWSGDSLWLELAGAILIAGVVQQFLIYAAVRYTVYNSSEFDERVDGIIYGAAAGLGYATAFNVLYVTGNSGVDLGIGALRVVTEALAFASLGGVSGYFISRARFDKMGPTWLPIGLIFAAVLNGVIDVLLGAAPMLAGGFSFNPWYGLIAAVIISGVIFFLLFRLIERLHRVTEMGVAAPESSALDAVLIGRGTREEPEWIVWVVAAALIAIGLLIGSSVLGQTRVGSGSGMSVTHPARWSRASEAGAAYAAYDRRGGGLSGSRVALRQVLRSEVMPVASMSLSDAGTNWSLSRNAQLAGYKVLNQGAVKVNGKDGVKIEYAYLLDTPSDVMPTLMHAEDTLVPCGAETLCVLSLSSATDDFAAQADLRGALTRSWVTP